MRGGQEGAHAAAHQGLGVVLHGAAQRHLLQRGFVLGDDVVVIHPLAALACAVNLEGSLLAMAVGALHLHILASAEHLQCN